MLCGFCHVFIFHAGLKLAAGPAAIVAPLPVLTLVFWLYTKRIAAHLAHLPTDFAADPSQVDIDYICLHPVPFACNDIFH